ncbi:glycosyltransferase family 4 protein [Flavobacterium sp. LS2P90]|uniref:Glycosyltransferase family 4 protein n=1 Tax=Flavobacterium xylosi TaxID=3230415 RepID=A0ABW6HZ18_9FLAO
MKILWITHDVLEPFFPFVEGKPTKGGSWIDPLFFGLASFKDAQMGMINPVIEGKNQKKLISGITYYTIPIRKGDNKTALAKELVENYLSVIIDFKPDIIHIHGTENNFGLIRQFVPLHIPIVCSIQGIISSILPYFSISVSDFQYKYFKSIKNWLGRGGIDGYKNRWQSYSIIEKKIISINKYFIGRTLWDKAQVLGLNCTAFYYHGEELLRTDFLNSSWDIKICNRETIFMSSGSYSLKGLHVLLKAVAVLKEKYPNIKVQIPLANINIKTSIRDYFFGEDYSIFIAKLICKLNLENNIVFFQKLNAAEMALQFKNSHVFVLSSFIENSPNSLGEAMMLGTPSVVSAVGGTFSMVKDGESALLFPSGDHFYLAHQIDRIFSNDDLAISLSIKAKEIASLRHNVNLVTNQYYNNYKEIIKLHHI